MLSLTCAQNRSQLCTRYCIVCHNRLTTDYEALKPYVCDSKLCTYQYYTLNRGPSLEVLYYHFLRPLRNSLTHFSMQYEIIHNPQTVDLLISLAYASANEGAMDEPLPIGMALRVPPPKNVGQDVVIPQQPQFLPTVVTPVAQVHNSPTVGPDGLCEFDDLDIYQVCDKFIA